MPTEVLLEVFRFLSENGIAITLLFIVCVFLYLFSMKILDKLEKVKDERIETMQIEILNLRTKIDGMTKDYQKLLIETSLLKAQNQAYTELNDTLNKILNKLENN